MECNQVTLTVNVSSPETASAVTNLIALVAGQQVTAAPTEKVKVPAKKETPKAPAKAKTSDELKKEVKKEKEAEQKAEEEKFVWTLDELKVRVPAVAKSNKDAYAALKKKIADMGCSMLNDLTGQTEKIAEFGTFVEEQEKLHGIK